MIFAKSPMASTDASATWPTWVVVGGYALMLLALAIFLAVCWVRSGRASTVARPEPDACPLCELEVDA